jgi:hypothetical protein
MKYAVAQHVFYPIATNDACLLVQPDDRPVHCSISEDTQSVHLWHGQLKKLGFLEQLPPKGSYLGRLLTAQNCVIMKPTISPVTVHTNLDASSAR